VKGYYHPEWSGKKALLVSSFIIYFLSASRSAVALTEVLHGILQVHELGYADLSRAVVFRGEKEVPTQQVGFTSFLLVCFKNE